jgi:methyl-accepting chemotaxis protein
MLAQQPMPDISQTSQNRAPHKNIKRKLRLNSIGSRLFLSVSGGALLGLSAMGFFFYQTFERQAESELRGLVAAKVGTVNSELVPAKQSMDDISSAVKALQENDVKDLKAYKQLAFEFFLKRPKVAMAAGFGQTPYALTAERQWFWPYFYVDQKSTEQKGERLSAPYNQVIYSELFKDDKYPVQDYYKTPASGKSLFLEPYQYYGLTITTYTNPIYNSKGKLLAVTGMDINLKSIDEEVKGKVLQNAGYYSILTAQGNLAAYSPDPKKVVDKKSYKDIPEFASIWSKIQKGDRGLVRSGGNFWVYQRIPVNNWILLAAVPERVITAPVLLITAGSTLAVGLLLAGITFLFVRELNKRLKPILDECNTLAATDAETQVEIQKLDEIGQLSTSFFNLLETVKQNEGTIRQEAAMRLALEEQQRQATESESMVLQADIERLLDAVSAVEEGNLTVQAPVSDRVTGLVSDTFNRLIEELNRVMSTVSTTAQRVTDSATNLEDPAQSSQQAKQQAEAVVQIKSLVQDVTQLTQNNTQQSTDANLAVQQAQSAVALGQKQMNVLNEEIVTLQGGSDQITRRVETLTEFVQLAAQFVKAQKRTAAMTRVLALNASLLSARATEQQDPEQFASISREFETITSQVNDLATQTNNDLILLQQRTDQIQTVVSGLSQDVREINQTVQTFTVGVDSSNQVFENIQQVTSQVVQVGQRVAESSQAIAQASQNTLASVQDIAVLAVATEQRADITREQSNAMGKLSRNLLEVMSFFQISAEQMELDRSKGLEESTEANLVEKTFSPTV